VGDMIRHRTVCRCLRQSPAVIKALDGIQATAPFVRSRSPEVYIHCDPRDESRMITLPIDVRVPLPLTQSIYYLRSSCPAADDGSVLINVPDVPEGASEDVVRSIRQGIESTQEHLFGSMAKGQAQPPQLEHLVLLNEWPVSAGHMIPQLMALYPTLRLYCSEVVARCLSDGDVFSKVAEWTRRHRPEMAGCIGRCPQLPMSMLSIVHDGTVVHWAETKGDPSRRPRGLVLTAGDVSSRAKRLGMRRQPQGGTDVGLWQDLQRWYAFDQRGRTLFAHHGGGCRLPWVYHLLPGALSTRVIPVPPLLTEMTEEPHDGLHAVALPWSPSEELRTLQSVLDQFPTAARVLSTSFAELSTDPSELVKELTASGHVLQALRLRLAEHIRRSRSPVTVSALEKSVQLKLLKELLGAQPASDVGTEEEAKPEEAKQVDEAAGVFLQETVLAPLARALVHRCVTDARTPRPTTHEDEPHTAHARQTASSAPDPTEVPGHVSSTVEAKGKRSPVRVLQQLFHDSGLGHYSSTLQRNQIDAAYFVAMTAPQLDAMFGRAEMTQIQSLQCRIQSKTGAVQGSAPRPKQGQTANVVDL